MASQSPWIFSKISGGYLAKILSLRHVRPSVPREPVKQNTQREPSHPRPLTPPLGPLRPLPRLGLLLDIDLGPALLRLSRVVLGLVRVLLGAVARQARHGAAHRARHPVAHPRREVAELPARFLLLPGPVLLAPGLLEALWYTWLVRCHGRCDDDVVMWMVTEWEHTSLPTTPPRNSLADPAVWFHDPAERSGSSLATPVEEMVPPGTLTAACEASCSASAFCCLALPWACSPDESALSPVVEGLHGHAVSVCAYLVAGAAKEAARSVLDRAGGGVDVGLESGGVVVGRHVDDWCLKTCKWFVCLSVAWC